MGVDTGIISPGIPIIKVTFDYNGDAPALVARMRKLADDIERQILED